jgi:hypothetical protein
MRDNSVQVEENTLAYRCKFIQGQAGCGGTKGAPQNVFAGLFDNSP